MLPTKDGSTDKGERPMQTVTFNSIEKLDFRTKESYKTLRTNLEFSGRGQESDFHNQLYAERGKNQRILSACPVNCGRREKGRSCGCGLEIRAERPL